MARASRKRRSLLHRHPDHGPAAVGYPRHRRSRHLHLRRHHPRTLPLPRPPTAATHLALRLRELSLQRRPTGSRRRHWLRPDPHHAIAPDSHVRRLADLPRGRRTLLGQTPPPRYFSKPAVVVNRLCIIAFV